MTRTIAIFLLILTLARLASAADVEKATEPIRAGGVESMLKTFSERGLPGPTEVTKPNQAIVFVELGGAYRTLVVMAKPAADSEKIARAVGDVVSETGMHPEKVRFAEEDGLAIIVAKDRDAKMWQTERTYSFDQRPLEAKLRSIGLQATYVTLYRKYAEYSGAAFPKDESKTFVWMATTGAKAPISITVKTPPAAPFIVFLFILFPGVCAVIGLLGAIAVARMQSIDIKKRRKLYPKIVYGFVFGSMLIHGPIFLYIASSGAVRPILDLWLGSPLMSGVSILLAVPLVFLVAILPLSNRAEKKLFGPEETPNLPPVIATYSPEEKKAAQSAGLATTAPLLIGFLFLFLPGLFGATSQVRLPFLIVGALFIFIGPRLIPRLIGKRLGVELAPTQDPELTRVTEELAGEMGVTVRGAQVAQDLGARAGIHASVSASGMVTVSKRGLQELTPEELRALVAHELAHLKLRHFQKRRLFITLPLVAVIALPFLMLFNRDFLSDTPSVRMWIMGVPILLYPLLFFYTSRLSKQHEFEADRLAVEATSAAALEAALTKSVTSSAMPHMHDIDDLATHPAIGKRLQAIRAMA